MQVDAPSRKGEQRHDSWELAKGKIVDLVVKGKNWLYR